MSSGDPVRTSHWALRASYLVLGPDLDADELTALTGVQPTWIHRRGDPNPAGRKTEWAGWQVRLGKFDELIDVSEALRRLFATLAPGWEELVRFGAARKGRTHRNGKLEVSSSAEVNVCVFVVNDSQAEWHVEPELVGRLAELSAGFLIDVDEYRPWPGDA